MMLAALKRRTARRAAAYRLYEGLVGQARAPWFYVEAGVADTVDGRFDMIVLHAFLLARRLEAAGDDGVAVARRMLDAMVSDMDRALREMGVGDLSVGRKVKAMSRAYMGRAAAYRGALQAGGDALPEALTRNVYRGEANPGAALLAAYVLEAAKMLAGVSDERLLTGETVFPATPAVR